jgi:uncharacterized protein YhbP (UPF0306 family)
LGYAPPKSTTSPHEKKESKLEEKKEKVAGKMSPSDKYMKLTYGMMREGEGKRFFKSYSRHKRKISGNKYGIEKKD